MFSFVKKPLAIRLMISGFTLAIFGFSFFCCLKPAFAQESVQDAKKANINFLWAFGALVQNGDSLKLESISEDRALKTGDQIKMLVELQEPCFVYLVHQNAQGELKLLFPYALEQFDSDYKVSQKYYIPEGNSWFELDGNIGRESFYLLSSAQRLSGLEALLQQYKAADAQAKPDIAKQITSEILRLKKENRGLATAAERPVLIGGAVRGIKKQQNENLPDVAAIAVDISAANFYGRTFTIDHQ